MAKFISWLLFICGTIFLTLGILVSSLTSTWAIGSGPVVTIFLGGGCLILSIVATQWLSVKVPPGQIYVALARGKFHTYRNGIVRNPIVLLTKSWSIFLPSTRLMPITYNPTNSFYSKDLSSVFMSFSAELWIGENKTDPEKLVNSLLFFSDYTSLPVFEEFLFQVSSGHITIPLCPEIEIRDIFKKIVSKMISEEVQAKYDSGELFAMLTTKLNEWFSYYGLKIQAPILDNFQVVAK